MNLNDLDEKLGKSYGKTPTGDKVYSCTETELKAYIIFKLKEFGEKIQKKATSLEGDAEVNIHNWVNEELKELE